MYKTNAFKVDFALLTTVEILAIKGSFLLESYILKLFHPLCNKIQRMLNIENFRELTVLVAYLSLKVKTGN